MLSGACHTVMFILDELSLFTSLNNLCQSQLCHSTHVYSSVHAVDSTIILSVKEMVGG